jgi:hypothetical protein
MRKCVTGCGWDALEVQKKKVGGKTKVEIEMVGIRSTRMEVFSAVIESELSRWRDGFSE